MSNLAPTCDFLLVIPAFEEHARLPPFLRELVAQLAQTSFVTHVQIVDDGSSAESQRELRAAIAPIVGSPAIEVLPILSLVQRRGKGCAIRTGWDSCPQTAWLAFVDADGAISATEVRRLFEHIRRQSASPCCVAVRKMKSQRSWHRGGSGRLFTQLVNGLFHSSFHDPQCGFKILLATAWQNVRPRSREDGFCFDLELLLLLKEERLEIEEVTIDWQEKSGGHFHLLTDGLATLLTALRLRLAKNAG